MRQTESHSSGRDEVGGRGRAPEQTRTICVYVRSCVCVCVIGITRGRKGHEVGRECGQEEVRNPRAGTGYECGMQVCGCGGACVCVRVCVWQRGCSGAYGCMWTCAGANKRRDKAAEVHGRGDAQQTEDTHSIDIGKRMLGIKHKLSRTCTHTHTHTHTHGGERGHLESPPCQGDLPCLLRRDKGRD